MTHEIDAWENCYPSQWKGLIIPEAMSHPAKFSSKLIRRIYDHMVGEGWLRIGDKVIDPFGGVALGALEAMRHGMNWTGMELELKFVDLGGQNIALWNKKFGRMPHWGTARLLQGDSRKMLEVVGRVDGSVSSPPYADGSQHTGGDDPHPEKMQGGKYHGVGITGAISSPPYSEARIGQESGQEHCGNGDQYGETAGQLGAMGAGDFSAALSSPPYADSDQNYKDGWGRFHKNHDPLWRSDIQREAEYGESEGQLSAMPPGDFNASISSPPFRQAEGGTPEPKEGGAIDHALYARHAAGNSAAEGYGVTPGNLGNMDEPRGDFDAAISSPPFGGSELQDNRKTINDTILGVGRNDGQKPHARLDNYFGGYQDEKNISNLPTGEFDSAVSSPPYNPPMSQDHNGSRGGKRGTTPSEPGAFVKYGITEGQLEGMDMDGFDASVSSPPFENQEGAQSANKFKDPAAFAKARAEGYRSGRIKANFASEEAILRQLVKANGETYGDTEGNIGNDSGETFWSAARTIVEQVYQALAPGGHAVWVVKNYVKNKQIVPFSDQWRQLCEAVGFKTLHEHHAMLVHHKGTSHTLEGGTVEHKTESKSFFRRLAESKGSPRIDFETVFCMVKE